MNSRATNLSVIIRRFFLITVIIFFIITKEGLAGFTQVFIWLPALVFILYFLCWEFFLLKMRLNLVYRIISAAIDIVFVILSYYYFEADILLLFLFMILFDLNYENGLKKTLIISVFTLLLFYLVSLLQMAPVKQFWTYIILQLLIKPVFIFIGIYMARYVTGQNKRLADENSEQKKQIKSKNTLLSTLSHELRTPLTIIKTSADILMEERPGKLNNVQRDFLTTVIDSAMRLIRLVENILAKIKIENTWLKLNLAYIDVRPVVKKVVKNMSLLVTQKVQTLRCIYPKLMSKALADQNWLAQVIINLIHNASKNINEHGSIVVSIKENEQYIVVSVSDDGCGIEDGRRYHLFTEYFTMENPESDQDDGIGLGLTIVKHVIEKHNGKIYVGSVPGMGTTFSFTLQKEKDVSA